jgi:primosomal protein N' (replication factor Y)
MTAVESPESSLPQFAQVAVPVHLRKLFTYRLPSLMQRNARVGSRVMVQLGTKTTAGYIVALWPRLRSGTSLIASELKEVQELLDVDPPLTSEVLEITRWVADYYAAPWGEVMRAALPAGINATVEQTISITERGRDVLKSGPPASAGGSSKSRALFLLADEGEFEIGALSLRIGQARPPRWLRELEADGLIQRGFRTLKRATRAKRRRAVRISSLPSDEKQPKRRITEAQHRAIDLLRSQQGAMSIVDLTEQANVSESVIRTLLKNGLVTQFEEELRRDPLAHANLPTAGDFVLTEEQAAALHAINEPLNAHAFAARRHRQWQDRGVHSRNASRVGNEPRRYVAGSGDSSDADSFAPAARALWRSNRDFSFIVIER